jgi:hypothetical protein
LEPSSGVMKPKPLLSLNHFTVPCVICVLTFLACWASSPGAPLPLRERQEPLEATCATLLANAGKSTGGYCEVAKFLGGYRSGQEGSTGHHGVSAHASSPAASPHSNLSSRGMVTPVNRESTTIREFETDSPSTATGCTSTPSVTLNAFGRARNARHRDCVRDVGIQAGGGNGRGLCLLTG